MDWTPVSYAYDGSFAGFLTCVFASYAHREEPMSFSTPEDGRISLWPERTVDTDEARAQRVYRSLAPRLGQEGRRLAVQGFQNGLHLLRLSLSQPCFDERSCKNPNHLLQKAISCIADMQAALSRCFKFNGVYPADG